MRYDDLLPQGTAGQVPHFQAPIQQDFARQVHRSMVLADIGPQPLLVAAVRELFPRLQSQRDRQQLMEALAQDPADALRSVLVTFRVGPALRTLITRAIHAQEAAERAHQLEHR